MSDIWTIYTDGGSRGNPGPAAYAYVIKRPGHADIEAKCYLGSTTNNIAEYTGMLKALEHAKALGGKKLLVNSDSELMVKQMNGQYKVKNAGLLPIYLQATALRKQFESVTFKHVYREQNTHADELCNQAMDDRWPTAADLDGLARETAAPAPVPQPAPPPTPQAEATPLMQALDVLQKSAKRWAKGDPKDPAPADVLNQIVEILQQNEER